MHGAGGWKYKMYKVRHYTTPITKPMEFYSRGDTTFQQPHSLPRKYSISVLCLLPINILDLTQLNFYPQMWMLFAVQSKYDALKTCLNKCWI